MNIGDNIKKFRLQKGMTQKELADKIDRSLRMLQKYESGDVEPSIEVLNEIANILGADFFDFIKIPNTRVLYGKESARLALLKRITPELISEIIQSLVLSGEINKSILIADDLEILTDNINNYIIEQIKLITNKNLLILESLQNPDEFYNKYMKDKD